VILWGDCQTDIHRKGGPAAGKIFTLYKYCPHPAQMVGTNEEAFPESVGFSIL